MLIVACQKCGAVKVLAGPSNTGETERVIWTCQRCGAGQIMDVAISKDARRSSLRNIIGGLALGGRAPEIENAASACDSNESETGC